MITASSPAPSTADVRRPRPASRRAARLTTVVPLGTAVAVATVLMVNTTPLEGVGDLLYETAFLVWNLLPMAAATLLLLWAGRRGWPPYVAATVGCVLLAGLTGWALHDFWVSDSSTSALLFIFLPIYQGVVVGVAGAAVAVTHWWSRRRG